MKTQQGQIAAKTVGRKGARMSIVVEKITWWTREKNGKWKRDRERFITV
jgi:hypothetical protein